HVDVDYEICGRQAAEFVFANNYVDGAPQNTKERLNFVGFDRRNLQVHGNDDVGSHLTHDVGGQVAYQTAIHKHLIAGPYGFEHTRNGHARSHGLGQATVAKNDFLSADQISCNTAIGNWEVVE